MKTLGALLMIGLSSVAFANVGTQDNVDYIVLFKSRLTRAQIRSCQKSVCRLADATGTGLCENISDVPGGYIVLANLSSRAAQRVSRLACVESVSENTIDGPFPSIGRGN